MFYFGIFLYPQCAHITSIRLIQTECDRERKRSSFTVSEVVAAIGFVIVKIIGNYETELPE